MREATGVETSVAELFAKLAMRLDALAQREAGAGGGSDGSQKRQIAGQIARLTDELESLNASRA